MIDRLTDFTREGRSFGANTRPIHCSIHTVSKRERNNAAVHERLRTVAARGIGWHVKALKAMDASARALSALHVV